MDTFSPNLKKFELQLFALMCVTKVDVLQIHCLNVTAQILVVKSQKRPGKAVWSTLNIYLKNIADTAIAEA